MASKNQNNKNSGGRRPQIRPMGYGMWIYGLLFLLIIGWSWLGGSESPVKTNWNTVEQMIADGDVESIEVVNKEQANVRLRSEAVEKYAARPEYKNIPRRGTHDHHIDEVKALSEYLMAECKRGDNFSFACYLCLCSFATRK